MNEIVFLNIPLVEWIGYLASTVVLISLSLSSILRLRIVNLFGSALFSFYGFYIGSLPVGIMNLIIVFFNLYYLQKLMLKKDNFEIIESDSNQEVIKKFLVYFKKDIQKYFPEFKLQPGSRQLILMVMRNMNFAGLFIAREKDDILEVELDYVTPQYRDYKNGIFLFNHFSDAIKNKKYKAVKARSGIPQQIIYLKKIGFAEDRSNPGNGNFYLQL
ncbi:MAG TPA: hypothetical protein VKA38_11665 [Draconibacterium sp.]|nr:hypothetical protein [Draconibacterium sp.]